MVISYIDTSALAKKYLVEEGTQKVLAHISETEYLFTSFLTELEIWATLEQAKRLRRLNTPAHREATASFERDIQHGSFSIIPMVQEIQAEAKRLVRQRGLKAPDGIQLASALTVGKPLRDRLLFLCADHDLLTAARLEGLKCHDVSIG